ncbi:MAG TPA: RluA family pseudouridine synthase [bacterium]|nr:RluA family pseudouridine synthase [bacterium]HNT64778.1 RluA family pseudouridine synthase [bacterium]
MTPDEMQNSQHLILLVPEGKNKERLDKFLTQQLPSVTRSKIQKLIEAGHVTIDGQGVKSNHLVRPGEELCVHFPRPAKSTVEGENIPLNIVYEDDDLLVVNKSAGRVVHPAFGNMSGTLVNALIYHCCELSRLGGETRPGLIHRLDKDTSGLLVVAKTDPVHVALARQLSDRLIKREYRALVWGHLRQKKGTISAAMARHHRERTRMVVNPAGKTAVTHYEVLQEFDFMSFVRLNLETGRTHQIRVHMSSIGHPVFADATYGGRSKQLAGLNQSRTQLGLALLKKYDRQMLHAKTLTFFHPVRRENMTFDSPLPDDMQALLADLAADVDR